MTRQLSSNRQQARKNFGREYSIPFLAGRSPIVTNTNIIKKYKYVTNDMLDWRTHLER
jgi:hypothetical protein